MAATVPSGLTQPIKMTDLKFQPWYTPREMLEIGVFGGVYFKYDAHLVGVPKELFDGLPKSKWGEWEYSTSTNFYNVAVSPRNRGLAYMDPSSKMRHVGWFHWYCQYYYQPIANESHINQWRILQWKEEIITLSHSLEVGTYTPPVPNPNNYNKYTDPAFLPEWKQHMIQFAWDPTKKPIDYGIR